MYIRSPPHSSESNQSQMNVKFGINLGGNTPTRGQNKHTTHTYKGIERKVCDIKIIKCQTSQSIKSDLEW